MQVRKLVAGAAVVAGGLGLMSGTAFAHNCFNPNKPDGAGVNYTIVGFGPDGPVFEQTGPGQGIGGFATFDGIDIHTVGNSPSHGVVGVPGSLGDKACDGKGIDLVSECFG